jgi:hypothetical protein
MFAVRRLADTVDFPPSVEDRDLVRVTRQSRASPSHHGSDDCSSGKARHSTREQTRGIRSTLALARVAAPTAEAERNVGSSPVCEAAPEVRPWAAVLRPGWRVTDSTRTEPEPLSRRGESRWHGGTSGCPIGGEGTQRPNARIAADPENSGSGGPRFIRSVYWEWLGLGGSSARSFGGSPRSARSAALDCYASSL